MMGQIVSFNGCRDCEDKDTTIATLTAELEQRHLDNAWLVKKIKELEAEVDRGRSDGY
jgi:hypothetical protein